MNKTKGKKKLIIKISSTLFYALGVICICFGLVGVNVIKNNSDTGKEIEAVNENLNKTVSTKELMTSYQTLSKQQEKKAQKEKAAKEKAAKEKAAKEEAKKASENESSSSDAAAVSSVSYSKSEYQQYAHDLVINSYGWTEEDFNALVNLWNRESGWNANSHSATGAHGIPQALPASKMSSEGSDYYSNGKTQIRWGLKYIAGKYGTASRAWQFFQNNGWY